MFNFLNTGVLFAAVAAVIPLIIHLFSKRKVKIIEFSSLKHLKAMQRRQVRRLKIRQLLLLILRMLIILLVVLAFARPTTKGGNIGSHASVSAVVLFDNSASMDRYVTDGNLFDLARKRTEQLLSTFGEADQVTLLPLVSTDASQQEVGFTSAAVTREQLNGLQAQYEEADLQGALEKTVTLLNSAKNLNKEVYIVSDRQRVSLPDSSILGGTDAHIYYLDLPLEAPDNAGIVSVDFGGQLIAPGHDFTLSASVKNYGDADRTDMIASLFLDGTRTAQTDFAVKAHDQAQVKFTRSVTTTGFHSGYVEISDDKFMDDNRYYFSFRIPDRFNLLVIDGDNTGKLLSLALAPSPTLTQYWSVKSVDPNDLTGVDLNQYDAIIVTGAPSLPKTYIDRLKAFTLNGNAIFVTYGGDTDIKYYNENWTPLTGVAYDKGIDPNFSRAGYYSLLSYDVDHPIFSVFASVNKKPPEVKFYTLPDVHLEGKARSLMRFTGDRPALVENSYGRGKVLSFNGPLGPRYSDLTGHAFFVPLISRIAEYLASDLSNYDLRVFCGGSVTRPLSDKVSISSALNLITPDSTSYSLVPEESQGSMVIHISPINEPGIYHVVNQGREIDRIAVNLGPTECDLTSVDTDQFAKAIGAPKMNILGGQADLGSVISQFRYGKELWQLFVWIALILIAIEIMLSRGSTPEES